MDLEVVLPCSIVDCPIGEKVFACAIFLAIHKLSHILVFVGILELPDTICQVLLELSNVHTSVPIDDSSLSLTHISLELTFINVTIDVYEYSFALSDSLVPFSLIFFLLFWCLINSKPVFMTLLPLSRVICAIIVKIGTSSFLKILADLSLVNLARTVNVCTLAVQFFTEPCAKADISIDELIQSSTISGIFTIDLSDVVASVRVRKLLNTFEWFASRVFQCCQKPVDFRTVVFPRPTFIHKM